MPLSVGYKTITRRGHPIAFNGKIKVHRLALYEKIGPGPHPCHWCGKLVDWMPGKHPSTAGSLISDHVDEDVSNNSADNLVPSCVACNSGRSKGRGNIRSGESFLIRSGRPQRADWFHCCICGKKYLSITNISGLPYKKTCSRACTSEIQSRSLRGIPKPKKMPDGALTFFSGRQRYSACIRTCLVCGREFLYRLKPQDGRGKVCSQKCRSEYNHLRASPKLISLGEV